MNAYLKAASDCFIEKSLFKCLVLNDNVNCLSYDVIDLCHTLKLMLFSSCQFFGLTVPATQQRLNLGGCNRKAIIWPKCVSVSYWHCIAI